MKCTPRTKLPSNNQYFVQNRIIVIICCVVAIAVPIIYTPFGPHKPPLCPIHGILGIPCPGCGMTRAFWMLLRLKIWDALTFNAFSLPIMLLFTIAPFVAIVELIRGHPCKFYGFLYSYRLARVVAIILICYHLGRTAYWTYDGTLMNDYVKTSWTYQLLK